MRKRKYRVWAPKMNQMLEWDVVKGMMAALLLTETETNIPMQFTGLLDKSGKEIYEGDIIQSVCETVNLMSNKPTGRFKTETYEVRWQEEKGKWGRWTGEKFELLSGLNKSYLLKWYTVIGNIYENPELLKQ